MIVSDWPLLREAFPEGAVHVQNTAAAIARGIQDVQAQPAAYRAGAARLREVKRARWTTTRGGILARLGSLAVSACL